MFKFITLTLLVVLLSSCASHLGYISSNTAISNGNFKVVGFAVGTASSKKILGLGGVRNENLVLNAKRNLYAHYPLNQGEVLSNITVDFINKQYLLFSEEKIVVSAEIISFINTEPLQRDSINYVLSSDIKFEKRGYYLNEKIYIKEGKLYNMYKISKFLKNKVEIVSQEDAKIKKVVEFSKLFKVAKSNLGIKYKVGDSVSFVKENVVGPNEIAGGEIKVVGIKNTYIIEYEAIGDIHNREIDESQIIKY